MSINLAAYEELMCLLRTTLKIVTDLLALGVGNDAEDKRESVGLMQAWESSPDCGAWRCCCCLRLSFLSSTVLTLNKRLGGVGDFGSVVAGGGGLLSVCS